MLTLPILQTALSSINQQHNERSHGFAASSINTEKTQKTPGLCGASRRCEVLNELSLVRAHPLPLALFSSLFPSPVP